MKLHIELFSKLNVYFDSQPQHIQPGKAQEMLAYLLLHPGRMHLRDILLDQMWPKHFSSCAKKALRQTLWQLRSDLGAAGSLVLTEGEFVGLDPDMTYWLDVDEFKEVFQRLNQNHPVKLCPAAAARVTQAVTLYGEGLLPGWYQDWYLLVNQRLAEAQLSLLDKLIEYYGLEKMYLTAIHLGRRLLRQDPAHERTHRRLMRYHYFSGDRTAALRQYQACVLTLQNELDVSPGYRTLKLYQDISQDRQPQRGGSVDLADESIEMLRQELQQIQTTIGNIQIMLENR